MSPFPTVITFSLVLNMCAYLIYESNAGSYVYNKKEKREEIQFSKELFKKALINNAF